MFNDNIRELCAKVDPLKGIEETLLLGSKNTGDFRLRSTLARVYISRKLFYTTDTFSPALGVSTENDRES